MTSTASNADGRLELPSTSSLGGIRVEFDGDAIIRRSTFLKVPGADVIVSVIPNTFDLDAFDQMARQPAIKRWLSPPPLVLQQRVLRYADLDAGTLVASDSVRAESDVDELVGHMTAALPELTGGVITRFSDVARETAEADVEVPITISQAALGCDMQALTRLLQAGAPVSLQRNRLPLRLLFSSYDLASISFIRLCPNSAARTWCQGSALLINNGPSTEVIILKLIASTTRPMIISMRLTPRLAFSMGEYNPLLLCILANSLRPEL